MLSNIAALYDLHQQAKLHNFGIMQAFLHLININGLKSLMD